MCHFWANSADRPRICANLNIKWHESWDDRLNSSKSGMWVIVCENDESLCVGTTNHPLWERRIILCGNDEFPSVGTTNDLLWQRGMIFVGNKE